VQNAGNSNGLALAPKIMGQGGVTLIDGPQFIALRARGIGDRPGNDDGSLTVQGYQIFDVMAGRKSGPQPPDQQPVRRRLARGSVRRRVSGAPHGSGRRADVPARATSLSYHRIPARFPLHGPRHGDLTYLSVIVPAQVRMPRERYDDGTVERHDTFAGSTMPIAGYAVHRLALAVRATAAIRPARGLDQPRGS